MQIEDIKSKRSTVLTDPKFNGFWEQSRDSEPSDQLIDAFLFGVSRGKRAVHETLEEKYRENVDNATKKIIQLRDLIKQLDSTLEVFLKINSPFSLEFLLLLSQEKIKEVKEEYYPKILELEKQFFSSNSSMIIHLKAKRKTTNMTYIIDDGYYLSLVNKK